MRATATDSGNRGRTAGAPNAAAIDAFVEAVRSSRGREICAFAAADVEVHDFMDPGRVIVGRDAFYEEFFAPIERSFRPVRYEVEEVLKGTDHVGLIGSFSGTFTCDYFGFPAHGRPVSWTFHDAYFFADGELVRVRFGNDTLAVAVELGARLNDQRLWVQPPAAAPRSEEPG